MNSLEAVHRLLPQSNSSEETVCCLVLPESAEGLSQLCQVRYHGNHLPHIADLSLEQLQCLPPQEESLTFLCQTGGGEERGGEAWSGDRGEGRVKECGGRGGEAWSGKGGEGVREGVREGRGRGEGRDGRGEGCEEAEGDWAVLTRGADYSRTHSGFILLHHRVIFTAKSSSFLGSFS